jgi:hypothetical protein
MRNDLLSGRSRVRVAVGALLKSPLPALSPASTQEEVQSHVSGASRDRQDLHRFPQPAPGRSGKPTTRARKTSATGRGLVLASGNGCTATRGGGEVIELECGVAVYPSRTEGGWWRAVWCEDGQREQCEAATEEKLAAKLEKVKIRLEADVPKMRQPGAALIAHYLGADRLPVQERWSRKHAHTQGRLCALYAAPVIAAIPCQDIKAGHMQQIVNAAPTAGERRPGAADDLRARHGGHRRRLPGELAARENAE